ncbi:MAG: TIGR04053 family radical SAM/SPASM domain-containing protein [Chloroflexi bacterium]|nr:TIGR04053 family radical SAM/SPASM domain-containing protein [Chloroflexota bacterium]
MTTPAPFDRPRERTADSPGNHSRGAASFDLNRDPFIVFWELTRACALACRHCRAEAQPRRNSLELSTEECCRTLTDLTEFSQAPIVVLSGGDPFMRRDLFDIIWHGRKLGLAIAVAPSATALVTERRIRRLVELGVSSISLSLDGASAATHDAFRGFPGTFDRTLEVMATARSAGLSFQVNTTVCRQSKADLPAMARLVGQHGGSTWDLFFLVPTGRARAEDMLTPVEQEDLFRWVLDESPGWPFRVKTTLGQHFRRALILRKLEADTTAPVPESARPMLNQMWRGPATNDGRGVMFISHIGDIYPSGFLPVRTGNVRKDSPVGVYRDSDLFRTLRDHSMLKGKCGRCPFNEVCGGSRARAFAVTGDVLAQEPGCIYQPAAAA